ncbi:CPBP family intramembrane glutamic endopeptidase [Parascardovia denticolens]|uniref:CPBP family intramembrane glutamic endopeptidase n=1 Tax=Parascardovia denticolens TaxID=78258 RepID=UPI000C1F9E2A|nr:type II CAAX endopeptidase family protein [Parascardovia denticolens]
MPQQQPGSQLPAAQGVYQPMGQPYPPLAFPHPYLPIPRPRKRRDPNRLPGDRAFFHVTDAASYLRSVAGYQWWRPFLTLFVALGWIAVCEGLSVCLLGVVSFAYLFPFLIQGGNSYHTFVSSIPADPTNWISILINFGFTALTFLPPVIITCLLVDGRPISTVTNRYGGMRWKLLAKSMLLASAFLAVETISLPLLTSKPYPVHRSGQAVVLSLVIILTVIPLQCAAEEYVFRGLLLQAFGRWIQPRFAWLIPIIPAFMFGMGHSQYDLLGRLDVTCMGLIAGYLVLFTGGLETGIALHTANNAFIFIAYLCGLSDPTSGSKGSSFSQKASSVAITVIVEILYALTVLAVGQWRHWFDYKPVVPPYRLDSYRIPAGPAVVVLPDQRS